MCMLKSLMENVDRIQVHMGNIWATQTETTRNARTEKKKKLVKKVNNVFYGPSGDKMAKKQISEQKGEMK